MFFGFLLGSRGMRMGMLGWRIEVVSWESVLEAKDRGMRTRSASCEDWRTVCTTSTYTSAPRPDTGRLVSPYDGEFESGP